MHTRPQAWYLATVLLVILAGIVAVAVNADQIASASLAVHFIDVGQGDAILLVAPDGTTALIDGGPDEKAFFYLQAIGIDRIDVMIATHPHADHVGGFVDILNTLSVGSVWTNGAVHTTGTYERFIDAIADHQVSYYEVGPDDTITVGDVTMGVFYGR